MNENNGNIRFLSAISYIGVFFFFFYFAVERCNPDLRFHKYQGGVLFFVFFLLYMMNALLSLVLSFIPPVQLIISFLIYLALTVAYVFLVVLGIRSAVKSEQNILPFIGSIAVKLRIFADELKNRR